MWNLVVAAGLSCMGVDGAALAEPVDEIEHKRTHDPLSRVLWSPPPALAAGSDVIYDEAQWGSPDAPFVFLGDTLRIGGSFESGRPILIGEQARIDVLEGAELRLGGPIANDGGSREGLMKLGAGTLELSGANSYRGNTVLLQGGLRVAGSQALGASGRTLNVNIGTALEYAPGVVVDNPVQLQAVDIAAQLPEGSWTPATPAQYADRARWTVAEGEAAQAGLLLGTAPFVKLGAGRLRISGDALAYWGDALVQEGALAADAAFSGAVTVAAAARLEGNGSVGSATIQAGGVLAPGASGNSGGSGGDSGDIGSGEAKGASYGSGSSNAKGASYSGSGGGSVSSGSGGGTSGGIGLLRVQGDLVLQAGARFEVDAGPAGDADQVLVGGKARLDGQLAVLAQAGDWKPRTQYMVLSAEGGLDGTRFASADSNFAFLEPSLDYDDKQVYLTLRRNDVSFEDVADDPDDELAEAVEEEGPGGGGDDRAGDGRGPDGKDGDADGDGRDNGAGDPGPGLYDRVVALDPAGARAAFRQLSGSWGGSLWSAMVEDSRYVREAVLDAANPYSTWNSVADSAARDSGPSTLHRTGNSAPGTASDVGPDRAYSSISIPGSVSDSVFRPGGAAGGPAPARSPWRFWSRAFHASAERADSGGAFGDGRDTQGLVLGATRELEQDTVAGLYLGFQRSRLRRADGMADASIDGVHAGLSLAGRGAGGLYVLGAGYSWQRLNSTRRVILGDWRDTLRDDYRAGLFQVFGEWSLPLRLAADASGAAVLEPYARLAWVRADTRGHAESGADAALDVDPTATATWFGALGLRLTGTVAGPAGPVQLRAAAAWRRAGGDLRAVTEQRFRHSARHASFHSQGQPIRRDAWTLDLGLRASLARDAELSLAYMGQYGSGSSDHGAMLSLSWRF
ncbi:autotransporter domain-containing protein [Candidimonas humi]|uniref:Autotransporter domain-containing protein n=1 Tax=Candidimonas humi TaxID=683355 RepID=A0ABV8NXH3_9BURK|nr:autotransporter domain-containing protein [Candidimonas humi]MBV6304470.1 autotransporter domain-containing protein [Candidimonas humi]